MSYSRILLLSFFKSEIKRNKKECMRPASTLCEKSKRKQTTNQVHVLGMINKRMKLANACMCRMHAMITRKQSSEERVCALRATTENDELLPQKTTNKTRKEN
jgi:hypothetical protein